ncbi:MAG: hypothetical protein ABII18_05060 [bacterium]|nr:acetoacetate decarboxylase family protein [bacterium]MBU1917047.1 acetoacetate decarboxylase family protein [bacterium]
MLTMPMPSTPFSLHTALQPSSVTVTEKWIKTGQPIVTQRPFVVQAGPVSRMWVASMKAHKATSMLEPYGLSPVLLRKQALVAATAFNYINTPSGSYNEAVVTVVATPDPARQKLRLCDLRAFMQFFAAPEAMTRDALLTMPDVPFVFAATDLFLDKEEPVVIGRQLMGLPKKTAAVEFNGTSLREHQFYVYDHEGSLPISAYGTTRFPITVREGGVGKPAQWMRFPVAARLPETVGPNIPVGVVVRARMALELAGGKDRLGFGGKLLEKYGEVNMLASLLFYDLEAGFNYP